MRNWKLASNIVLLGATFAFSQFFDLAGSHISRLLLVAAPFDLDFL
jgi:hypothetical protein